MKLLTSRLLHLPISLLLMGLLIPTALVALIPDGELFLMALPQWLSSCVYLSLSLLATRLTYQKLIESSLPEEGDSGGDMGRLQANSRTAELLIMGISLLSLSWGTVPHHMEDVLPFISMRLGFTLFLLGGMVLLFAHVKMRGLQEERL